MWSNAGAALYGDESNITWKLPNAAYSQMTSYHALVACSFWSGALLNFFRLLARYQLLCHWCPEMRFSTPRFNGWRCASAFPSHSVSVFILTVQPIFEGASSVVSVIDECQVIYGTGSQRACAFKSFIYRKNNRGGNKWSVNTRCDGNSPQRRHLGSANIRRKFWNAAASGHATPGRIAL